MLGAAEAVDVLFGVVPAREDAALASDGDGVVRGCVASTAWHAEGWKSWRAVACGGEDARTGEGDAGGADARAGRERECTG